MLNKAVAFHQAQNLPEAERRYRSILARNANHFDALHLLGVCQSQQGKPEEANRLISAALEIQPKSPEALSNLALVLHALGRHHDALARIGQALAIKPAYAEALNNQGTVLQALNRFEEALESYDKALAVQPVYLEALVNRGHALQKLNRPEEALGSFDRALAIKADYPALLNNRGNLLNDLNRLDEALASYDRALAMRPDYPEALYNRGILLRDMNRFDEALASFDRALTLRPDYAEAFNNRGTVLLDLNRLDEAMASFDRALAIRPDYADARNNRGNVLKALNRPNDAIADYEKAVADRPDYAEALHNLGLAELLVGDFVRGWAHYEWRWQVKGLVTARNFSQPLWLGQEDLSGKTILLHAEQGFGDTLQMCRYAPLVSQRGAKVLLEVQPALKTLMANLPGTHGVLGRAEPLPAFDYHCPLLSLPHALGTRLETIPAVLPGLSAPADRLSKWESRLGPKPAPRVGIAWSGRPSHTNDRNRSLALGALAPLLSRGVQLVSLQVEVRPGDRAFLDRNAGILHFGNELKDFADTAALASLMDLVISVDTSVAHLAGALGKPLWVLLPFAPDWRWLLDREDSPWYPTARLFRQPKPGDWDSVIQRVVAELGRAFGDLPEMPRSPPAKIAPKPPTTAETLNKAVALHQAGNLAEAERQYRAVLAQNPRQFDALHLLGVCRSQQGKHDEAYRLIGDALEIRPDHPEALSNQGLVLQALGRQHDALAAYDKVLALKPDYPEVLNNRGNALQALNRIDEAIASFDKALALKPDYADALNNRGNALKGLGRLGDALAGFDQAIAVKPDHANALYNRGNVLREVSRLDEALVSYDKALAIKPDYPEAHNNRGNALQDMNRLDDAVASFENALAVDPDYADAHFNYGLAKLLLGDFAQGSPHYEWRWKVKGLLNARDFDRPPWLGTEDLSGKTILLHAEQGLGDTIQFCRYAPLVSRRGAKVLLEVQPPLKSLLGDLKGAHRVLGRGEPLPAFDYHCPLLSLPLAMGTRLETIPAGIPYLSAPAERRSKWQARLGKKAAPRVGLVWSGRPTHKKDAGRSIALVALAPLLSRGVQIVSLQKEVRPGDRAYLDRSGDLLQLGDELQDFADTAALCSLMDLVISVDTSVAHLAGALGKPVWILLPFSPDWRWLLNREDSPWYPTARLFRQPKPGDWDSVIRRVAAALAGAFGPEAAG